MGQRLLTGVQLYKEAVAGTPAAATVVAAGLTRAGHSPTPKKDSTPELRGLMTSRFRHPLMSNGGLLRFEGYATFEDLVYWLNMCIKGGQSSGGAGDGGTPPAYTRTWTHTLTAPDLPDSYSVEIGDNTQYWRYPYVFGTRFGLSGRRDEEVRFSVDAVSWPRSTVTKTASLSAQTTETLIANLTKLYIDNASGGTIGTTQYGGCLLEWNAEVGLYTPFKCMDGTNKFTSVNHQDTAPTLDITVAVDAALVTLLNTYLETEARLLVRLENSNPTAIHTTVFKRFRWDLAMVLLSVDEIGGSDVDGKQTVRLMLESEYNPATTLVEQISLVNALSAVA